MRQKSVTGSSPSERLVKTIRRATRKQYSAEEKIRIVLDGLRGEASIAELCRREGIAEGLYYSWSKRSSWRPANVAWLAIRPVRQPAAR
jgi:transposase